LRKKSGQVKFVEQGFMQDLLMWWNGGFGVVKSAAFRGFSTAPKREQRRPRSLEQTGSRDGEQVDRHCRKNDSNRLSHHGKHSPFQTAS
jgi:hypothetical protein